MPEININLNGILKLLSNLQPHKAAGPDEIRPIVLIELRTEIAPIIQLIFENLSPQVSYHLTGRGQM